MRCDRPVECQRRSVARTAQDSDNERTEGSGDFRNGGRPLHRGDQGAGQADQLHASGEHRGSNDDTDNVAIGVAHAVKELFGHFVDFGQGHGKSERCPDQHRRRYGNFRNQLDLFTAQNQEQQGNDRHHRLEEIDFEVFILLGSGSHGRFAGAVLLQITGNDGQQHGNRDNADNRSGSMTGDNRHNIRIAQLGNERNVG